MNLQLIQQRKKEDTMDTQPTFGRYTEIPADRMSKEQREAYEKAFGAGGSCPGPYKIWVESPALMDLMIPIREYSRKHFSLNDAEREIATVVTVSKIGSPFPICKHERIAEEAGIPAEKVERMITGLPVVFDDPRQQVIYEVATALLNSRYVTKGLYERALKLLGNKGVSDVTVILGYYSMVSYTLAFHDVPSSAEGMKR
jgi:4-carboxymuconolactone decarboxylase